MQISHTGYKTISLNVVYKCQRIDSIDYGMNISYNVAN